MNPIHSKTQRLRVSASSAEGRLPHSSLDGMEIICVEHPHPETIHFVNQILKPPAASKEARWGHTIAEAMENPLQSLFALHEWITNPLKESGSEASDSQKQRFAPLALETRVIFAESNLELVARRAPEKAATKTITGFGERAIAATQNPRTP